jgi:hypothetical protein
MRANINVRLANSVFSTTTVPGRFQREFLRMGPQEALPPCTRSVSPPSSGDKPNDEFRLPASLNLKSHGRETDSVRSHPRTVSSELSRREERAGSRCRQILNVGLFRRRRAVAQLRKTYTTWNHWHTSADIIEEGVVV